MFANNDSAYLERHLSRANVVLFLGAGFSTLATNRLGNPLPVGKLLARYLWEHLQYEGEFDETGLGELFEAALKGGVPHQALRTFLEDHLMCAKTSTAYEVLAEPYWYRIYTTNVDDVVERAYQASSTLLEVVSFPHDEPVPRDQYLRRVQLVHLNGRLPCSPSEITFSPQQFAKAAVAPQPLYDQFVRDYRSKPVLFLGTTINEPLLWKAIEERSARVGGVSEQRPKSFLIAPTISQPKRVVLEPLNIVPVEASVEDFLDWLRSQQPSLPSKEQVLRELAPELFDQGLGERPIDLADEAMLEFFGSFVRVPTSRKHSGSRSQYLLGASPRWEDLLANLDAPRSVTRQIVDYAVDRLDEDHSPKLSIGAILGSAGSGKSTILRRTGIGLENAGYIGFLTNSEVLPSPAVIRGFLDSLESRAVLLFDNAEVALSRIAELADQLGRSRRPPVLLLASRTNDFDRLLGRLKGKVKIDEFHSETLNRQEIDAILEVLETNGSLGDLAGKTQADRIKVFEEKAKKQILVAMREATSGKGFDEIIEDEYRSLVPDESRALCLCVALATDAGYRLSRRELLAAARVGDAEAAHLLARNLRDVIIPSGNDDELLMLRHRAIATHILERVASRPDLRDAYCRLLTSLASVIKGQPQRSRPRALCRRIQSHKIIHRRFKGDIEEAREVYRKVSPLFRSEAHFWLQFGNLELEGKDGDLQYSEHYLTTASSLQPGGRSIQNAKGHLYLRQAVEAPNRAAALGLRTQGTEVLQENIANARFVDEYAVHILAVQRYYWAKKWLFDDSEEFRKEIKWLKEQVQTAVSAHPRHRRLKDLMATLETAYLQTAISPDQRPEPPEIEPL